MSQIISFIKPSEAPLGRPGVSDQFLKSAGVRRVSGTEAQHLCGCPEPGIWIPFRTVSGKPVKRESDATEYGRLRLNTPREDRKYHQRAGSKPYGYIPANLHELTGATDLVVVEGEFKALALAEVGIAAVGVGGLTLALTEGQLVSGLREVVQSMAPSRVIFLGDGDTSLIFAFSREALKLARVLSGAEVLLPRIGLDGPGKGIDDCRAALGDAFNAYWGNLVAEAEPVSADDTAEQLALRLLRRESPAALKKAIGFVA